MYWKVSSELSRVGDIDLGKQLQISATTSTFHSLAKTISENQLLATVPALTTLDMGALPTECVSSPFSWN